MIGDNIKKMRKTLGLTQQQLADRIGMTQTSIALVESGKRNMSRQALLSISREFGVCLEWLETSAGEMFSQRNLSTIEQLAAEFNLTEQERELITNFLSLPPDVRDMVAQAVSRAAKLYPRKPDTELNRAEMHEMLDDELDDREAAKKEATTMWSASTPTSGSSKKFGKPIA